MRMSKIVVRKWDKIGEKGEHFSFFPLWGVVKIILEYWLREYGGVVNTRTAVFYIIIYIYIYKKKGKTEMHRIISIIIYFISFSHHKKNGNECHKSSHF